ncbi:MAG TPA: hypothetical protein VJZ93_00140 [Candidatus Nanoarchaeia archaeon]|nr:hypothetical protein [Candidatus Nanoarchaeia archaeon]
MKRTDAFWMVLLFFIATISVASADVISKNSGGSGQMAITYGENFEGFFSCVPQTCSSLGYTCDSWSNSCGATISCGTCSSGFTCTSGTCVANPSSGDSEEESSSGGGGGGGGGGGSVATTAIRQGDLFVNPEEVVISVVEGVEEYREITLKNNGQLSLPLTTSVEGELKDILLLNKERIMLPPGVETTLGMIVTLKEKELLTGKIIIAYSIFTREVPVVVGSKSENFLFDISVYLSEEFKQVNPGDKVIAQFNLLEVGANEKVDVAATYIIKDFQGQNHYEESETFFVDGEKSYSKEFLTDGLPVGKYALGYEIAYPGAFATSSVTFDVIEPKAKSFLIIAIILFSMTAVIILVIWVVKSMRNQTKYRSRKKRVYGKI